MDFDSNDKQGKRRKRKKQYKEESKGHREHFCGKLEWQEMTPYVANVESLSLGTTATDIITVLKQMKVMSCRKTNVIASWDEPRERR
jgi:hypothetical protein